MEFEQSMRSASIGGHKRGDGQRFLPEFLLLFNAIRKPRVPSSVDFSAGHRRCNEDIETELFVVLVVVNLVLLPAVEGWRTKFENQL